MHIKLTNGYPVRYTLGQLRRDNPSVSFPKLIPDEVLAEHGVYPVKATLAPEIDAKTHSHAHDAQIIGGEWVQVWEVAQLPLGRAEANVRASRDDLLQDTDWVVAKAYEAGTPVPTEWASYRQALRDITTQEGFPYSVTWPTKP